MNEDDIQVIENLLREAEREAAQRSRFYKSGQHFIRVHNETVAVAAMCIRNPDGSPVGINR